MSNDPVKDPSTGNAAPKSLAEEILDTLWEPLLVLEEDLRVRSANDAFYVHFQVKPEETVGRKVYDLGNGQWDIPLLRELLEEVLPNERLFRNFEIQHTFDHIGKRTLLLNARQIDHLQLILLAMEDVTGRKEKEALQTAKAAAEETCRAKSEFLANMGHEIRTPMTAFMMALELLLQLDKDPERRRLLTMADQSARSLRTLLEEILDFSRIEAQGIEIEEEPFELRLFVKSTVQMMSGKARAKKLQLDVDISPEIPVTIIGDSGRLRQILLHLIDNAIKFTDQGEVRISVRNCSDNLEFSVSDTGIGIPEDKSGVIFQHFSQGDGSFTRRHGGTGLGLAISKGLVELMGGQIGGKNRPGGGSVFFFTLPLKAVKGGTASPETRVEAAAPHFPVRILLVDDDAMICNMLHMAMTHRGWQTETAENGREAVEKLKKGRFDLIVMDLQMPEMNGLEATRVIRQTEDGRRIYILGLTAHTRREVKAECLAAGMDKVLTKPVQMNELCSVIDSCLSLTRHQGTAGDGVDVWAFSLLAIRRP
jgi:signal transduction histidine kinase/ActR/RegA family two-component response regulator